MFYYRASQSAVGLAVCACALFSIVKGIATTNRVYDDYTNHPCIRTCDATPRPMVCVYNFYLEHTMTFGTSCGDCPRNVTHCYQRGCVTADGNTRHVMTVNQQVPGPAIHVCQGDTIVVRVTNDLLGTEGTSIHWHGLLQHGYQHMDGTSHVTQCQIPVASSFEYRFPARDPGTHLWHSHSGSQQAEGIHGALVIRQPARLEPHLGLYDRDLAAHTMLVTDWQAHHTVTDILGYMLEGRPKEPTPERETTLLINGRGVEPEFFTKPEERTSRHFLPLATFTVERGLRYRFRVISNGVDECPIQVSIDGHNLTMIASDGIPFERTEVESFYLHSGERYDFILHANQPVGNYWIRLQGNEYSCSKWKAFTAGVLRYKGAAEEFPSETFTSYEDAARGGRSLNKWNVLPSAEHLLLTDLTGMEVNKVALRANPDHRFYLQMDLNLKGSYRSSKPFWWPQINEISLKNPPAPPLTQLQDLDEDIFCNEDTVGGVNCTEVYCECVYRRQVSLGDVVELVVVDDGSVWTAVHPMHLHGYKFYVVGIGKLGENTTLDEVKRLDEQGKLPRNLVDPVAKDTVATNDGGYMILRWHATNPGFWLFHCHVSYHLLEGQGMIFQVGEPSQMPPVPRNFPRCGDWAFTGYDVGDGGACTTNSGSRSPGTWGALLLIVVYRIVMGFRR